MADRYEQDINKHNLLISIDFKLPSSDRPLRRCKVLVSGNWSEFRVDVRVSANFL